MATTVTDPSLDPAPAPPVELDTRHREEPAWLLCQAGCTNVGLLSKTPPAAPVTLGVEDVALGLSLLAATENVNEP